MTLLRTVLLAAPFVAVLATSVVGFNDGTFPGKTHPVLGTVPADVARGGDSCGTCHLNFVPLGGVTVSVTPDQRSLDLGQRIMINTTVSGGPATTFGGFVAEATAGTFADTTGIAEAHLGGTFISHMKAFLGRTWDYAFDAPATPGLIELFIAGNASDADGTELGEEWAFHGDSTAQVSVPVRLYANAPGVTAHGASCEGSFGNYPVLGAKEVPQIGKLNYAVEMHGAAPGAAAAILVGVTKIQFPLGGIGVTDCTLYVQPILSFGGGTTPGTPMLSDGMAAFPLAIPGAQALVGKTLEIQALVVDTATSRSLPFTMTNGLSITVQP
ncbi:MAG: choice-of-anchor V domain-containing protein [Planctomycetota bacterium]